MAQNVNMGLIVLGIKREKYKNILQETCERVPCFCVEDFYCLLFANTFPSALIFHEWYLNPKANTNNLFLLKLMCRRARSAFKFIKISQINWNEHTHTLTLTKDYFAFLCLAQLFGFRLRLFHAHVTLRYWNIDEEPES